MLDILDHLRNVCLMLTWREVLVLGLVGVLVAMSIVFAG